MLVVVVCDVGVVVVVIVIVGDDVVQFGVIFDWYVVDVDLIIISGGVSVGVYEVVKDVFGSVDYWGGDYGVEFVKVVM